MDKPSFIERWWFRTPNQKKEIGVDPVVIGCLFCVIGKLVLGRRFGHASSASHCIDVDGASDRAKKLLARMKREPLERLTAKDECSPRRDDQRPDGDALGVYAGVPAPDRDVAAALERCIVRGDPAV